MFQSKHIAALGRILFVLLLVANSGFTMVLHTCLMPEMSCCEPSERNVTGGDGCDHARAVAFAAMPFLCCQLEIVGGVDSNPISTDRPNDSGVQKLIVVATILHSPIAAYTALSLSSTCVSLFSERAGPNPVDRYILNATFLI